MAKGDKETIDPAHLSEIPHERPDPRPDFSKPLPRKALPKELQDTLSNEEKYWDALYDGSAPESTDTSLRYAAYASRVRTILIAGQRYIAYTSDIGESFRPVAHPNLVRGAYAVSWLYLTGDVAHEGYKAYLRNQRMLHPQSDDPNVVGTGSVSSDKANVGTQPMSTTLGAGITGGSRGQVEAGRVVPIEDYRAVMAQRAVFQSIASMGLPAFTIHSIVKYTGIALKNNKNKTLRMYGPIGLGLAAVPALPFLFDKPVEHATEWVFHKGFELIGGPEAVSDRPAQGRGALRHEESKAGVAKEKEL